jgi:hypothetical protein
MTTMTFTETLRVTRCWCGMAHAVPQALYDHMLKQRDNNVEQTGAYCPLGHVWIITGESALNKERQVRERAEVRVRALRDQLDAAERSHRATKGQLTKARKRADRGVCQHCNRSFVNVARHVAHMHPAEMAT